MRGRPDWTFMRLGERAKAAAESGGSLRGRAVGGLPGDCSGQTWHLEAGSRKPRLRLACQVFRDQRTRRSALSGAPLHVSE